MSKRARNSGQYDLRVSVDPDNVYGEMVTVVAGGLLPLETDSGENIPARVRDDLIKNHESFTEVDQAQPKADEKKEG